MKSRCYNKNNIGYRNYGGRGISVCDEWRNSFQCFLRDMGRKPSPKHGIERIDVNGNYSPSNCKWATHQEQQVNKRNNAILTFNGEHLTKSQWSERIGIWPGTINRRLKKGRPLHEVLWAGKFKRQPALRDSL